MSNPMNNNSDSQINTDICEAAGCFSKATEEISVKVGNLGIMHLLLCKNCVNKFEDNKD
jgi:hypothetical protein